jgi:hypothetical protein
MLNETKKPNQSNQPKVKPKQAVPHKPQTVSVRSSVDKNKKEK